MELEDQQHSLKGDALEKSKKKVETLRKATDKQVRGIEDHADKLLKKAMNAVKRAVETTKLLEKEEEMDKKMKKEEKK
jgi:hypothetical protein